MTDQQAETVTEDAVAAYLEAHPKFFEHQPELVAQLRVPHASVACHILDRTLGGDIAWPATGRAPTAYRSLIARAQDFESLSARLHALSL